MSCPWCGNISGIRSKLYCRKCIGICEVCDEYFCPECGDKCTKCERLLCLKCVSEYPQKLCINCYGERRVQISSREAKVLKKIKSRVGDFERLDKMDCESRGYLIEDPHITGINLVPYFEKISLIPNEIFELENLIVLGLAWNAIEKLPEELKKLEKLEILDLRHNNIINREDLSIIRQLPNLKKMYLTGYGIWEYYEDPRLKENYRLTTIQNAIRLKGNWDELTYKDIIIAGKVIKAPYQFDLERDRYERPKFVIQDNSITVTVGIINIEYGFYLENFDVGDHFVVSKPLRPSKNDEFNGTDFLVDVGEGISTISSIRPGIKNRLKFHPKRGREKKSKIKKEETQRRVRMSWGIKSEKDTFYEGDDWDRIDHKNGFEYGDQS